MKELAPPEAPPRAPCASLRTKMIYVAGRARAPLDRESSTACYWCLHTMSPVGPDDGPVRPRSCTAARGCYRADEET